MAIWTNVLELSVVNKNGSSFFFLYYFSVHTRTYNSTLFKLKCSFTYSPDSIGGGAGELRGVDLHGSLCEENGSS